MGCGLTTSDSFGSFAGLMIAGSAESAFSWKCGQAWKIELNFGRFLRCVRQFL
jgi:hypothetical protein